MMENKNGKYRELIIHPGVTLKELIDDRNINQEELAIRTGVSPKYVSEIISGKKGISRSYAKKLEHVFFGLSSSFWINLQDIYDKEIKDFEEYNNISN